MSSSIEKEALTNATQQIYSIAVAQRQNGPRFNSTHEGAAVIRDAHDELWAEIKKLKHALTPAATASQSATIRQKAIELGALSARLAAELDGLVN